jgi:hypothetical protein
MRFVMNDFAFDTPYKAIHFSQTGRDFTKRLRQVCGASNLNALGVARYEEIKEKWAEFSYKSYGDRVTKPGRYYFADETHLYRLVGEIRRPGRPYSHRIEYGSSNVDFWTAWMKAIISLDNPVDTPEAEALIADLLSAMEKAFTPDPKPATELV